MTRGDFFKSVGLLVASSVPMKMFGSNLSQVKVKNPSKSKLIVDIRSISSSSDGWNAKKALELYAETGVLVYDGQRGNPPQFIECDDIVEYD